MLSLTPIYSNNIFGIGNFNPVGAVQLITRVIFCPVQRLVFLLFLTSSEATERGVMDGVKLKA
jgi:hypothetical protein